MLNFENSLEPLLNIINQGGVANDQIRNQLLNLFRGGMPPGNIQIIQRVEPRQEYVTQLMEMGFPENRCRRVLSATNNDMNIATEMMLTDQDIDLPEDDEQSELSASQSNNSQQP